MIFNTNPWRFWTALALAIGTLLIVLASLARGDASSRLLQVDTSSAYSFKDFFQAVGVQAVGGGEERKADCEARPGGQWVGRWRGPSGAALTFCADKHPVAIEWGYSFCTWVGLRFVAVKFPFIVICERLNEA